MDQKDIGKEKKDCEEFRLVACRVADDERDIEAGLLKLYNEHAGECKPCAAWKSHNDQIIELAVAMPQFDISEALTQKILSSVENEKQGIMPAIRSLPSTLPSLPLGVIGMFLMVVILPFDTVEGAMSWACGLAGLVALKLLVSTTNKTEQATN